MADFLVSRAPEPHRDRAAAILRAHPEIRALFGRNPHTIWCILGLVLVQLGLAWWVRAGPWWLALVLAYAVGAFVSHALYVLMHETNHNLLFQRRAFNSLAGILANLPSLIPSSVSFQRYHLKHHANQGIFELDGDMPSYWEARLIAGRTVAKALWLLFFPFFLMLRPAHLRSIELLCPWTIFNIIVVFGFDAVLVIALGPIAVLYLFCSMCFSLGLHPVGARWIQEHYVISPPQETYSYYGPLNRVAFNIGYHNEHHDFPGISWDRIPRVRSLAPEWYDGLVSHRSWSRLLIRFILDPRFSLFDRVARADWRAAVAEAKAGAGA